MKTKIPKRDSLVYYLKIVDNHNLESTMLSKKKLRIARFVNTINPNFKSCYLRVTYKPGIINEGVYTNKADLINAWKIFSEEDLIKEVMTY
jgi:hypothetical protein